MPREWTLQLSRSTFSLVMEFLYDSVVHAFFASLGVGAVIVALLNLFGSPPTGAVLAWPTWKLALSVVIVGALSAVPLRGLVVSFRDVLRSRVTVEGPVTEAHDVHVPGKNGGYRAIRFTVAGESFEVAKLELSVTSTALGNNDVKLEYRPGSRSVARLWTRRRD